MSAFDDFKKCCALEAHLDFEALDFALFQPLQKFLDWWSKQGEAMKAFVVAWTGTAGAAAGVIAKDVLTKFLTGLGFATNATIAVDLALLIISISAGAVLGTALSIMSVCMARVV